MKNILLFSSFIILTAFSCKKKDNIDPNKFIRCKVNGKEWVAKESVQFSEEISASWRLQGKYFELNGFEDNTQINIGILDTSELKNGVYNLNSNSKSADYRDYDKSYSDYYRTDSVNNINTGTLSITFDKKNKTVSGSFSFKAKYTGSNESVEITDGSFVIPYHEY